jgi:hypothetical protein
MPKEANKPSIHRETKEDIIKFFLDLNEGWIQTDYNTLEYEGKNIQIWISFRPHYCDRGSLTAHIEIKDGTHPAEFSMDEADAWPRMFFHPDTAWKEINTWLMVRNQKEKATE